MNLVLAATLTALAALPVTHDTWPAFRGDGTSVTPAQSLPLQWSPTENIAWSVTIRGYGQSSPVIWKDRVFLSSIEGEEKETCIVSAVNLTSGEPLWQHTFAASQKIKNTNMVSRGAPTPVVDATGVYVFFESGDLIALSHDGTEMWRRNLVTDYGVTHARHGLGNSLAHTDNTVFVLLETATPSLLLAFNKADGTERWKAGRDGRTAWTTPVVAGVNGRETLLVSGDKSLVQYDAESGEKLQTLDALSGISIPSPTVAGDVVVVGSNSTRPTEGERTPEQSNCAVRLASADGSAGLEVLWEGQGAQADYASPLIHQGKVYFVTARGDVQCRDLMTGTVLYSERVHPCWATPVAAGDRIYLFGKDGEATVIQAGETFKVLAQNRLWAEEAGSATPEAPQDPRSPDYKAKTILYAVAVVDGTIIARTGEKLFAIRTAASS